jgi:nucleoside-diphosphate-sugar epimerase
MSKHVIIGAGPVGSAVAEALVQRSDSVVMVTRSGRGPEHPSIERIAADATDAARLADLAGGAVALYNCANPRYTTWLTDWPPLHASILTAAEQSGAVLVNAAPLYGYGPMSEVMTPQTPLAATHPKLRIRADMWRDALALHQAGRIRVTEVRASDYIEANGILSFMGAPLLAGRRAYSPSPLRVPHSWSSIHDLAQALVTVAADTRAYGRAWMSPTHEPMTVRQFLDAFTTANGVGAKAKVAVIPYPVLWTTGLFNPFIKELRTTHYQFTKPFVIDSSETEQTFGLKPRPLAESLRAAAAAIRSGAPAPR